MKFTANGETYELDETTINFAEGEAVERVTGMSFQEVGIEIKRGSLRPMRAMIWIAIKRVKPELKFDDVATWTINSIEWSFQTNKVDEDDKTTDGAGSTKKAPGRGKRKASVI